ncbi:nickel ABC transporter permease subunit NikC [Desulfosarcina ovata]|uniref:Nickel ABC transporter permease subunit NikC n=1 Tax=Desulfosarcina ovata subsp. ovata TaxID=2752305 RepID=A0A5K8AGP1_9BACT|nr:nickel ABC transporter permease subunit NikC [Desulfosarcina ovata]BBO91817.1 nickel ABC transporter permease subunit NikC [Desulfosarcina ovata subsp. ovata]
MKMVRKLLGHKLIWFALPVILAILAMALFAPWIAPHPPDRVDLSQKLEPPGKSHLLGTDHLGRDILSRLIWGARASMGSVFLIINLIMIFSLVVGCLSGFLGGWVDSLFMRICEVFLTFPTFILAMFLIGVLGTGMFNVILAIFLTHWAWYARIIRGLVLSLRNSEYILASRVAGTRTWKIILRHIVPPVLAQLTILATLDIGHMMLHVSGLSFLGLGIQPPTPEWGVMINDARQYIWTRPELIMYPGIMIFLAVLAFNIPGDILRDSLDPAIQTEGD